jgi:hypothetical protein
MGIGDILADAHSSTALEVVRDLLSGNWLVKIFPRQAFFQFTEPIIKFMRDCADMFSEFQFPEDGKNSVKTAFEEYLKDALPEFREKAVQRLRKVGEIYQNLEDDIMNLNLQDEGDVWEVWKKHKKIIKANTYKILRAFENYQVALHMNLLNKECEAKKEHLKTFSKFELEQALEEKRKEEKPISEQLREFL